MKVWAVIPSSRQRRMVSTNERLFVAASVVKRATGLVGPPAHLRCASSPLLLLPLTRLLSFHVGSNLNPSLIWSPQPSSWLWSCGGQQNNDLDPRKPLGRKIFQGAEHRATASLVRLPSEGRKDAFPFRTPTWRAARHAAAV